MSEFGDIIKQSSTVGTNRYRVILLCFLAATTFWFLNALNKEHTATIQYPLEFLYNEADYMPVEELPRDVTINVNGIGWNLLKNSLGIKVSPLQIPIENPVDTRRIAASLLPSLISEQLNDFQLNYVLTDTLHLNIDRRIRRTVFLAIDTASIATGENVRLKSPVTITPDSVVLEGPGEVLDNLNEQFLIQLNSDEIDRDFDDIVNISLPDNVRAVSNSSVRIRFLVQRLTDKSIRVPISLQGFPDDSTWVNDPEDVLVRYKADTEEELEIRPEDFRVIADFTEMSPDDSLVRPRIVSFPNTLVDVHMDSVRVRISQSQ